MASSNNKPQPKLPPVEAVRPKRPVKKAPANHSYSIFESFKRFTGIERDLIWGPFYKRFRAVRKESATWSGFNLGVIWEGIPTASQTRPGKIVRLFNAIVGWDPAPNLTPAPRSKSSKKEASSPTTTNLEDWQAATKFGDDWSPSQIDFTQWYGRLKHPANYDDEFYTANFKALYNKLCDFSETWFGQGIYLEDWRDNELEISTWEVPMTEQFVQYARIVAHEDRGYVNWKDILNDPRHRKWLCVSILSQIIERRIFNQLLFGADETFQRELDRHDSHWLIQEGFTRKEGRRQIARAAVGEHLVPANFWDAVDDLAGQTVLIFQPLFMLMCMVTRRTANSTGAAFWQELHTILALAGYFQVCTAVSPDIFHILSATPGVRFQWEEEDHADQELYEASKRFHRSHEDRWRVLAELSSKGESAAVTKLVEPQDVEDSLYVPYPTSESEYRVEDHRRRRGGKVMYAVFPKLTRYAAENVGNIVLDVRPATSLKELAFSEGMRIALLSRTKVVYYQGLVHDDNEMADGVPLDDHLRAIELDRLTGGFLPYWQHYWNADGTPRLWLHWPLVPEGVDKFWLGLMVHFFLKFTLENVFGPFEFSENYNLYKKYLFRPVLWFISDILIYVFIRLFDLPLFEGRYVYVKTQLTYLALTLATEALLKFRGRFVVFTLFAWPLIWLDQVFLQKLPALLLTVSDFLDNEDLTSIANRAAGLFGAANGAATG